jgi:hypothetical protein
MDCDKDKGDQDIRLVCMSDNKEEAGCDHLFQNGSPEGKIIRLPNSCGVMPFARVAKQWVPQDQSIPNESMKKIVRRDEAAPQVKAMRIDTNFAAADKKNGDVNLAVQGTNFPIKAPAVASAAPKRRSRLADRGLGARGFFDDAINGIVDGAQQVGDTIKQGADAVVDGAKQVGQDVVDGAKQAGQDVVDVAKDLNKFNQNDNKTLKAITVDKKFDVFNANIDCPAVPPGKAFSATLNADAQTKANAILTVGVVATGTIVPPKLDEFSIFAGMNADFDAALHIAAKASGEVDSGPVNLFEIGVPGLDFPKILSIGPTFKINGQVKANLDVDLDMTVNIAYTVKDAQMVFPPNDKRKSGGDFKPADSNLKLSATPSVAAKGTLEGHIIPTVDFGINVLSGLAEATVFLDLDAAAILGLELNAAANVTKQKGKAAAVKDASVDGCVDISASLDVEAGARGAFLNLFNEQTKESLFNKKFELFKKCFDNKGAGKQTNDTAADDTAAGDAATQTDDSATPTDDSATPTDDPNAATDDPNAATDDSTATADSATATEDPAVVADNSAAPAETSAATGKKAGAAGKKSAPVGKKSAPAAKKSAPAAKKSAAPAKKAVPKKSAKKAARSSLQERAKGSKGSKGGKGGNGLGCGIPSIGGTLTSLAGEAINAASIKAI